jgi:hypothetical protein
VTFPLSREPRDVVRLAGLLGLLAFAVLLISGRSLDLLGSPLRIGLVLAWLGVTAAFWVSGRVWLVVAYLLLGGLLLRWVELPPGGAGGSDVLAATDEAIEVWIAGGNPYDHVSARTRPPGQPMPYTAGALLVHLPGHLVSGLAGVQFTQFVFAGLVMASMAWAAWLTGWLVGLPMLALYAGAGNLVLLASDGSNDTATGALLLLAIAALGWALRRVEVATLLVAGAAAALALASKQLALPIVVALVAVAVRQLGWRRAIPYLAGGAGLLLLISLPFLLRGPVEYFSALVSFLGVHEDIYGWNIWALVQGLGGTAWDVDAARILTIAVGVLVLAGLLLVRWRSLSGAVLGGVVATLLIMFVSRWTTYAYFGLVLPVALAIPILLAWERQVPLPPVDVAPEAGAA